MQLGAYFPTPLIGTDPVAIRDYVQSLEGAGFDYVEIFEHVSGADTARFDPPPFPFRPRNSGVTYNSDTSWHEPLTLYAFLAGVTSTIEFTTSVLLLAQRQTVLVAKQVAELDILSEGRFRLAVGIGWNFTEYEALGMDWATRTARIEEQIEVLRLLWTNRLVTFEGRFHHLDRVGLNPLPPRGVLPIYYASSAREVVIDRVARVADGWMPLLIPPETPELGVERLHEHLARYGKDPAHFGIDARARVRAPGMPIPNTQIDDRPWTEQAKHCKDLGATYLCLSGQATTAAEVLKMELEAKHIFDNEVGA